MRRTEYDELVWAEQDRQDVLLGRGSAESMHVDGPPLMEDGKLPEYVKRAARLTMEARQRLDEAERPHQPGL